jgi:D-tyrosyl-tRNA(Tyr) deacylase
MRALIQRVADAKVVVEGETVGEIGRGLLVFLGAVRDDDDDDLAWICRKLTSLRIFPDGDGKMNKSVCDIEGKILLVSQFTLCADVGKGTRPSFSKAMAPDDATQMVDRAAERLAQEVPVQTGRFGADMKVSLLNDGPVTLWLDSKSRGRA